ncbi:MAG: DEAD/DEAH box helicase [Pseudomonadota bacterium]|nr:DEAD/DEAH box helicase [Pseudomonadota bacterium]
MSLSSISAPRVSSPSSLGNNNGIAPGARVCIRDEDWVVRKVDPSDDGGLCLTCDGISELVRGTTGLFLTKLDTDIALHRPEETELYEDASPAFINTLLYLEAQRLQVVPNDERLHRGHLAVMNTAPYQLVPAQKALRQVRTRLLIGDGVGLGKTLEAAILATELDVRGRGRRVLVITQKSMLTQFQKEWWSRFTIPLVRLDSQGIARVRNRIPSGHNPFNYYDKTIISMDTLKGRDEYRAYLDQSRWDLIVIDECHNVANRSTGSDRAALAKQLATRSDSLVLLSATPHDGSAKSFASLIWLLDPTAISDPEDYSREDLDRKELFVRRFKKDIKDQAAGQFLEPAAFRHYADASPEEEAAYRALLDVPFTQGGVYRPGKPSELQRVGLQKAIFSSPAAAVSAVANRIKKLDRPSATDDELLEIAGLRQLAGALTGIGPREFAKYQAFLSTLKSAEFNWSPKTPDDRLVIFSERIETLRWLQVQLIADLGLPEKAITVMTGADSDIDQQTIVDRFGKVQDPLRILLCSDVASEGLNLHYCSHRLFHFDLPWSLMVFQQRNGRVDRFGQKTTPQLHYLITRANTEKIKGDLRILEILQIKDEQITKNIGDPASFLIEYDPKKEADKIADFMAEGQSAEQVDDVLEQNLAHKAVDEDDWETEFFESAADEDRKVVIDAPDQPHSFFDNWYAFAKSALKSVGDLPDLRTDDELQALTLTPPSDLDRRLRQVLPIEVRRQGSALTLSARTDLVEDSIRRAREAAAGEDAWPDIHFLWPQHPVFHWMTDHVIGSVGRQRAPVIVSPKLAKDERAYLMLGLIPNRKGQPLVAEWKAVVQKGDGDPELEDFVTFSHRAGLQAGGLPNRPTGLPFERLQSELGNAVAAMQLHVEAAMRAVAAEKKALIDLRLAELEHLKGKQIEQLELRFDKPAGAMHNVHAAKKAQRQKDIEGVFHEYRQWVRDTLEVEPVPYVQVLAAVTG